MGQWRLARGKKGLRGQYPTSEIAPPPEGVEGRFSRCGPTSLLRETPFDSSCETKCACAQKQERGGLRYG